MKTIAEIKAAIATANTEVFNAHDAASIIGIGYSTLCRLMRTHFKSIKRLPRVHGGYQLTANDIIRIAEYWNDDNRFEISTPVTANPEPAQTEYVSPIDVLIHIDKTINEDPNVKAYYDMKNRFEQMNEAALQRLFKPVLERFKFKYICEQIPEIQSQMLTCINKGKLRGMEKYGMDFNAFLKLVKFAHDNYVPLDAIDDQGEGVNA